MKRYIKSAVESLSGYDWKTKYEIASDPETTSDVLEQLADSDSSVVTNAIIGNDNVTADILDKIADNILRFIGKDADILERIAQHPKVSKNTLAKIVTQGMDDLDESYRGCEVLIAVAENPNTSLMTLKRLSNCSDLDVRNAVAKNPNSSSAILRHMVRVDNSIIPYVLTNPNIPMELLLKLAKSTDHWTREGVACNPSTPPEVLTSLASDESYYVRESLAENVNTPIDVLKQLANDDEWMVAESAKVTLRKLGVI